MKKIILLSLCVFHLFLLQGQVVKTVNLTTPGTLSTSLSADEKNIITNLILSGVIDVRDFKTMRDEIPLLAELDLENVNIAAYDGSEGTSLYANTYPENQIPDHAFYNDNNPFYKCLLTSFIVPVSATSIGESAFFGCEQLSSVDIPSGIESIAKSAFCYCRGLVSLNISEGVSHIGESAFNECTNLASVSIPTSVRTIEKNAFQSCYKLSSLTILNGVTFIGESAFLYCQTLSSVILPSSVTTISKNTFYGCKGITSIIIPSSVTSIESNAFSYCGQLNTITIPSSVSFIGESAFSNSAIHSITIPPLVKTIENYTFSQCWNLSSVEIPEVVTSIGESAFFSCSMLGSVTIPSSVISIGDAAFNNCSNLSSVVISEGVTSIGRSAFISCSRLKSVNIPSSVTTIGMNAFNSCSELASIKTGFSVPLDLIYSINAFYRVDKATCELQVPYGTKSLYATAYEWKDFTNIIESPIVFNLSSNRITIAADESSNASIKITSDMAWTTESNQPWLTMNATSGTGNGTLIVTATANPSLASRTAQITVSLNEVASQTITVTQEAKGLNLQIMQGELSAILSEEEKLTATKLTLTGNIDARDFRIMRDSMPNLSLIDLSNAHIVTYTGREGTRLYSTATYLENEIPEWAFHDGYNGNGKASLTYFIYPKSAATIGKEAFSYCFNLTSAILPSSMNSIGSGAFMYCPKLRTVTIPEGVQSIGASAFANCSYLESVTIPSTVNSIGSNAFDYCERLSSVILKEGVKSIGEYAFSRCMSLSSVIIPSSVLSIGNFAFSNCERLSSVKLSEGVANIGEAAFSGCGSLIAITIPSSVTSIKALAFENCHLLSFVKVSHLIPLDLRLSPGVFNGVDKTICVLYIPSNTKSLYGQADQWKDFVNSIELGDPIIYPFFIADNGAPDKVIDLKTVFLDDYVLTYTITSNSNEQVVTATISGSELTFIFSPIYTGKTEIVVTAFSNGKEIKAIFYIEVKMLSGIGDLEAYHDLQIYPNPTRGIVLMKFNSIPAMGTNYFVYDASGRVIYKSMISNKEETINLQGNPPGVYFIKMGEKANDIFKIVLQ